MLPLRRRDFVVADGILTNRPSTVDPLREAAVVR